MASPSRYLKLVDEPGAAKFAGDCHVCLEMAQGKPLKQQLTPAKTCQLCSNHFCENHKGKDSGVCEIEHETYYNNPAHRTRHAPMEIFPSLEARAMRLGNTKSDPSEVLSTYCV